ncbi:MAG: hypothetical protein LBR29_00975 [Methylobacteriaceae bacterium]|jgi:hypothetical protein|nr:hypothetical protein [Methylobacteriaceae bacterium]
MGCVLKNRKHETFCWLLASNRMDPVEAFRMVGYRGGLGWLWRLLNREDIGRRVREIGGLLRRRLIEPVREGAASAVAAMTGGAASAARVLVSPRGRGGSPQ